MKRIESRRKNQRGNAIVEFALAATLLLLMFCGVTGFSRIFNVANMAAGAAEAGVQYGALSPTNNGDLTGMQKAALNDTGNYTGATATASQVCFCSVGGTATDCPASCTGSDSPETYVKVVVTIPYSPVITFPMLPDPINITESAMARVQ